MKYNLGSDPLGNLLKTPLLVKFEGLSRALRYWHGHALVEVGCGLQVLVRLLFQLLTELLPFYCMDVCCRVERRVNKPEAVNNIFLCVNAGIEQLFSYLSVWACGVSAQPLFHWHQQFFPCHPE